MNPKEKLEGKKNSSYLTELVSESKTVMYNIKRT